tara:strand:+ start:115 stop:789 length:675 start_codon:yes stop_codon:yes gene_type:complete
MSLALVRVGRWAVIAAGAISYPFLAHYSTTQNAMTETPWLGVGVSLAPSLAILLFMTWNSSRKPVMLLLCAVIGMLLWGFWGTLERNFSWAYFIQHAGTNLMLAAMFGVTLMRDRQALCSRFAEAVHGELTPELVRYTRQLTLAWVLFFIIISLISSLLFAFAPIRIWSIFANFLTFPLVILMFVIEFMVRLHKLPNLERHNILDGILAFWKPSHVRSDTPPVR